MKIMIMDKRYVYQQHQGRYQREVSMRYGIMMEPKAAQAPSGVDFRAKFDEP